MEASKLTAGVLFGALGNQIRLNALVTALSLAVLVGGNLALDQLGQSASFAPSGFLSLAVQFYVTRSAVARGGLLAEGAKGKLWSFWGMNIVTGIAILAGCVVLILPGLYLAARWFVAGPAIFAEDETASGGMRQSWELTRSSVWQIAGAILVVMGGGFAAGIVPLLIFPENNAPIAVQAFSYFCMFGATVCSWLMAVGAYELLTGGQRSLEEVFA